MRQHFKYIHNQWEKQLVPKRWEEKIPFSQNIQSIDLMKEDNLSWAYKIVTLSMKKHWEDSSCFCSNMFLQ